MAHRDSPVDTPPVLPTPGSSAYIQTLMRILVEHPSLQEWQFDPVVFFLLLLSAIVKRGGVILDVGEGSSRGTADDGRGRVVDNVRATCQAIYGLDALRLDLDPSISPHRLPSLLLKRRRKETRRATEPAPMPPRGLSASDDLDLQLAPVKSSPQQRRTGKSPFLQHDEHAQPPATPPVFADDPIAPDGSNLAVREDGAEWPDVVIVTGLEDCGSPVQYKLIELLKRSAKDRPAGREALLIWVRREEASESIPAWLADNFILRDQVWPGDMELPPSYLESQALIPRSYIADLNALLSYTHIHPPLTQHLNNLISATSTHPNLHSTLTARFFTTLPLLVKAHRLISAPFALPSDWTENLERLARPDQGETQRFGLGGGMGGVNVWARRAGEEPDLAELGDDGEEWFVDFSNVRGVWSTAVRHRVRWREMGEGVMWNIQTSAAALVESETKSDDKAKSERSMRKKAKRRREAVDSILDDMLDRLL